MRVLVDECAPPALRRALVQRGHHCRTVPDEGWSGKQNGELLALAENEFDALITLDTNLRYQQNCTGEKSRSCFSEPRLTVLLTSAAISQPVRKRSGK